MTRIRPALLALLLAFLHAADSQGAASVWPGSPGYMYVSNPWGTNYYDQDAALSDGAGGGYYGWPEIGTIRVQRKLVSGLTAPGFAPTGNVACPASPGGQREYVQLAPDGAHGVYVAWVDYRPGDVADIYVQRVLADGTLAPGWPATGLRLTTTAAYDYYPTVLGDASGLYVSWIENAGAAYVHKVTRLTPGGAFAAGWTSAGVALHQAGVSQFPGGLASDGSGGVIAAFLVGSDLRVQRVLATGVQDAANWPSNGRTISTAYPSFFGGGRPPSLLPIGGGNSMLAWSDSRFGQRDAYVVRITPTGVAPGWAASGAAVAPSSNDQVDVTTVPDAGNGVFVVWYDFGAGNLMAQHLLAGGAPDGAWPAGGQVLAAGQFATYPSVSAVSDGAGGVLALSGFYNSGTYVVAARRRVDGSIPAEWGTGLIAMMTPVGVDVRALRAVPDGEGGAIALLTLFQSPNSLFEAGQRVRWDGSLGLALRPHVTAVRDVGPDQGGSLRVFCHASEADTLPNNAVASYALWRQVPGPLAQARAAPAAVPLRVSSGANGLSTYWEYLGAWPTRAVSDYSQVVSTVADSLPGLIPWERFVVDAIAPGGAIFSTSQVDSGYSVDNLPPLAPAPFTGTYASGATHLSWGANAEPDLNHYVLHRGATAGFVPGPGTLIASPATTTWVDPGAAGSYYKLAAVDAHGNAGAYALLSPNATTDVAAGELALAFARPSPNPMARETALRFSLPEAGRVELSVFDAGGRRVRRLVDGTRAAGSFIERWDGRDGAGRALPDGLYLARLAYGGRAIVQRLTLLR